VFKNNSCFINTEWQLHLPSLANVLDGLVVAAILNRVGV
jgi:hypothetical protein